MPNFRSCWRITNTNECSVALRHAYDAARPPGAGSLCAPWLLTPILHAMHPAAHLQVRKALLARGWDLAWIDGVTGEIQKRKLQASVAQIEAVVGAGGNMRLLPGGCTQWLASGAAAGWGSGGCCPT